MSDDDFSGISRGGEDLREDTPLSGIEIGDKLVEGNRLAIVEGIKRRAEEVTDRFLPEQPSTGAQVGLRQVIDSMFQLFRRRAELEERRISPVRDATTSTGSSTAATIAKGSRRQSFDIFYDLDSNDGELIVEVSLDKNTWRPYASLDIPSGGDRDIATGETVYTFVRVYPEDDFDNSDVNLVEIVSSGAI